MPPFWVGFSKQRKKPGWRRSSICVQNAFFQLFPSWPDKKKTAVRSNFTISVSCHHFGWAFPSSRKSRGWRRSCNCVQNAFFQLFPSWPDKKNSRGIKFYNFSFMPPFWVGFSKQRKKPRLTKVVQLRSKRVFSTFPILARQKKQPWDQILQFQFHATILGGLFQAAEKAGLTKVL